MPTLVIVGAQWGDEAKGKVVDCLAGSADLVVRYSGGNNAGHTVITGGREFKFHLIPAGILHPNVTAVLAAGMVICPKTLLAELDRAKDFPEGAGNLAISSGAHLVLPYHVALDQLEERARGANSIGTTSRGIGPAYEDKVGRNGIRMAEFLDPMRFRDRLCDALIVKNRRIGQLGGQPFEVEAILAEYAPLANRLASMVTDTDILIHSAVSSGKRVLFEGAQGTLLDLDCGTYPFVTSSHPVAAGACLGTGIGPRDIDRVIGVTKAYTTRVGAGPFPTELNDEVGEWIRQHGKEFGTTTGRGRRCGWLDLVLLKHSARVNSLTGLVLTRLDILAGFEKVKVAVRYRHGGREFDHVPQDTKVFAEVEPVYEELPGWGGELRSARKIEDLPAEARAYLKFMEDQVGVPIAMVSIGPDREETIFVRPELLSF
jgi:adenylosuccinate synthase